MEEDNLTLLDGISKLEKILSLDKDIIEGFGLENYSNRRNPTNSEIIERFNNGDLIEGFLDEDQCKEYKGIFNIPVVGPIIKSIICPNYVDEIIIPDCNIGFKATEKCKCDTTNCRIGDYCYIEGDTGECHIKEKVTTDPCENVDCGDYGTCDNGQCICDKAYEGVVCRVKKKKCKKAVCNNGKLTSTSIFEEDDCHCECLPGWEDDPIRDDPNNPGTTIGTGEKCSIRLKVDLSESSCVNNYTCSKNGPEDNDWICNENYYMNNFDCKKCPENSSNITKMDLQLGSISPFDCICDDRKSFMKYFPEIEEFKCIRCSELGKTKGALTTGDESKDCVCDVQNGWVTKEDGSCTKCPTMVQTNSSTVPDSAFEWVVDSSGVGSCLCNTPEFVTENINGVTTCSTNTMCMINPPDGPNHRSHADARCELMTIPDRCITINGTSEEEDAEATSCNLVNLGNVSRYFVSGIRGPYCPVEANGYYTQNQEDLNGQPHFVKNDGQGVWHLFWSTQNSNMKGWVINNSITQIPTDIDNVKLRILQNSPGFGPPIMGWSVKCGNSNYVQSDDILISSTTPSDPIMGCERTTGSGSCTFIPSSIANSPCEDNFKNSTSKEESDCGSGCIYIQPEPIQIDNTNKCNGDTRKEQLRIKALTDNNMSILKNDSTMLDNFINKIRCNYTDGNCICPDGANDQGQGDFREFCHGCKNGMILKHHEGVGSDGVTLENIFTCVNNPCIYTGSTPERNEKLKDVVGLGCFDTYNWGQTEGGSKQISDLNGTELISIDNKNSMFFYGVAGEKLTSEKISEVCPTGNKCGAELMRRCPPSEPNCQYKQNDKCWTLNQHFNGGTKYWRWDPTIEKCVCSVPKGRRQTKAGGDICRPNDCFDLSDPDNPSEKCYCEDGTKDCLRNSFPEENNSRGDPSGCLTTSHGPVCQCSNDFIKNELSSLAEAGEIRQCNIENKCGNSRPKVARVGAVALNYTGTEISTCCDRQGQNCFHDSPNCKYDPADMVDDMDFQVLGAGSSPNSEWNQNDLDMWLNGKGGTGIMTTSHRESEQGMWNASNLINKKRFIVNEEDPYGEGGKDGSKEWSENNKLVFSPTRTNLPSPTTGLTTERSLYDQKKYSPPEIHPPDFIPNVNPKINNTYTPENIPSGFENTEVHYYQKKNKDIFYPASAPPELKTSYLDWEGNWIHKCSCGKGSGLNPLTGCQCSWGEYYDYEDPNYERSDPGTVEPRKGCKPLPDQGCATRGNSSPWSKSSVGDFYNLMNPMCVLGATQTRDSYAGNDDGDFDWTQNCCVSCAHKFYAKGNAGLNTVDTDNDGEPNRPDWTSNDNFNLPDKIYASTPASGYTDRHRAWNNAYCPGGLGGDRDWGHGGGIVNKPYSSDSAEPHPTLQYTDGDGLQKSLSLDVCNPTNSDSAYQIHNVTSCSVDTDTNQISCNEKDPNKLFMSDKRSDKHHFYAENGGHIGHKPVPSTGDISKGMKQMMALGTNSRPKNWMNFFVGPSTETGKSTSQNPALFTNGYNYDVDATNNEKGQTTDPMGNFGRYTYASNSYGKNVVGDGQIWSTSGPQNPEYQFELEKENLFFCKRTNKTKDTILQGSWGDEPFEINYTYRTPPGPVNDADIEAENREGIPVSGWPNNIPDNVHRNEYYSFDSNYKPKRTIPMRPGGVGSQYSEKTTGKGGYRFPPLNNISSAADIAIMQDTNIRWPWSQSGSSESVKRETAGKAKLVPYLGGWGVPDTNGNISNDPINNNSYKGKWGGKLQEVVLYPEWGIPWKTGNAASNTIEQNYPYLLPASDTTTTAAALSAPGIITDEGISATDAALIAQETITTGIYENRRSPIVNVENRPNWGESGRRMIENKAISGISANSAGSQAGTIRTDQSGTCAFEYDGCQGFGGVEGEYAAYYHSDYDSGNVMWNTALFQPGAPDDMNTGSEDAVNNKGLTGVWTKIGNVYQKNCATIGKDNSSYDSANQYSNRTISHDRLPAYDKSTIGAQYQKGLVNFSGKDFKGVHELRAECLGMPSEVSDGNNNTGDTIETGLGHKCALWKLHDPEKNPTTNAPENNRGSGSADSNADWWQWELCRDDDTYGGCVYKHSTKGIKGRPY